MIMTTRFLVAALVVASPAIASAQVVQNVHGDVAHFGEGFTAITESRVDFRLLRPSNVVLFWFTPECRIDLFIYSLVQPLNSLINIDQILVLQLHSDLQLVIVAIHSVFQAGRRGSDGNNPLSQSRDTLMMHAVLRERRGPQ